MITYLCPQCGLDSAMTELEQPHCFYCEASNMKFIVIKKQKLTPKVMAARLKLCTDRMMENLQKAYEVGKKSGEDFEEGELIDIMAKAKKLQDEVIDLEIDKEK